MATKKLFNLPETPVDKYKVEYWSVDYYGYGYHIDHVEAVYYVNTPYEVFRPGETGGAPIKDDWMICDNGSCTCRIERWAAMGETHERFHECFLTLDEAKEYCIKKINERIAGLEEQIAWVRKSRDIISKMS